MSAQVIEKDGKPAFVILPIEEWKRIKERLEDLDDVKAFDEAKARDEETFPASVVDALLAGESPIKVYRKHRGLNQKTLAERAGIAVPYLSQLETGAREPSLDVAKKLAATLGVTIDDLV